MSSRALGKARRKTGIPVKATNEGAVDGLSSRLQGSAGEWGKWFRPDRKRKRRYRSRQQRRRRPVWCRCRDQRTSLELGRGLPVGGIDFTPLLAADGNH